MLFLIDAYSFYLSDIFLFAAMVIFVLSICNDEAAANNYFDEE